MCAFVVPARWLPWLLLAPSSTVLAAIALDPAIGLGTGIGAINSTVITTVCGWLIGARLRRTETDLSIQRRRVVKASTERTRHHYALLARQRYLTHTQAEILPWLRRIATGDLDTGAPGAKAKSHKLAIEARDDLYANAFLESTLRRHIGEFRERGGVIDLRPGLDENHREGGAGTILETLLTRLPGTSRVTMAPAVEANRVRIDVVPAINATLADDLRKHGTVPLDVASDAFATTISSPEPVMAPQPATESDEVWT